MTRTDMSSHAVTPSVTGMAATPYPHLPYPEDVLMHDHPQRLGNSRISDDGVHHSHPDPRILTLHSHHGSNTRGRRKERPNNSRSNTTRHCLRHHAVPHASAPRYPVRCTTQTSSQMYVIGITSYR